MASRFEIGEYFFKAEDFILKRSEVNNFLTKKPDLENVVEVIYKGKQYPQSHILLWKDKIAVLTDPPRENLKVDRVLVFFKADNLYIKKASKGKKFSSAFSLKNKDFALEVYFRDSEEFQTWHTGLSRCCIKTDVLRFYKLKKKLDKGGFAVVYLGERKRDGEFFALKMMDKRKVDNEKSYRYTVSEIEIMRMVDHPNIVNLIDVYDNANHLILVLELMDGGNLSKMIKKRSSVPEKEAFKVIHGIFEALSYLHRLNIVHRDLKPANIMFKIEDNPDAANILESDVSDVSDPQETVRVTKVVDFGLCADLTDHSSTSLLNDKSGTVGYLAPELITKKRGEFYDDRVDVFSAGMIFYEMITGKNPFKASDYEKSMYKNYICELDFNIPGVTEETIFFMRHILAKRPECRFTAERALEDEYFLKLKFDEHPESMIESLSKKIPKTPHMPLLKKSTDDKHNISNSASKSKSRIDSKYLQSTNFRIDYSFYVSSNISHLTLLENNLAGKSKKSINTKRSGARAGTGFTQQSGSQWPKSFTNLERRNSEDIDSSDEENPITHFMVNYN